MTLPVLDVEPSRSAGGEAMRKLSIFLTALVVAAGAFWATMLTTPPQTVAAQPLPTINVNDLMA